MKLDKEFLLHHTGTEAILVPTGAAGFSGIVRGNKTLGAVLELLKTDRTEAELIEALQDRFDAPAAVINADARKVLAELRRIGALDE